ncbi:hypothetical protein H6G69_29405 [Nostoc sp. FACHB-110]|nr:hypothetical protein [Nostoc sp. FACHB-110]
MYNWSTRGLYIGEQRVGRVPRLVGSTSEIKKSLRRTTGLVSHLLVNGVMLQVDGGLNAGTF